MAKGDIKLSKKHGLQPVIPLCLYCGEQKDEIRLYGAEGDKLAEFMGYKDGALPMSMHIPGDLDPCTKCKDTGNIYIVVVNKEEGSIVTAVSTAEEQIKKLINDEDKVRDILNKRVVLVDPETALSIGILKEEAR
jgi:hypothetical protein